MQPSIEDPGVGTSNAISFTSTELPSARFVWSLRLICLTALGISLYLAWTSFSMGEVFGCGGGEVFDCNDVMTSQWSKVAGVPVSIPAGGLYACLLSLLMFARRNGPLRLRQMVWGGMTLGGVMAGLAALWFIGLQVFVLHHLCAYCLVVHGCGIILAGMVLTSGLAPFSLKFKSSAVSILGVTVLIGIQIFTPKPDQYEIVRYDNVTPSTSDTATVEANGSETDVFAAPDEVFAAPVDVFEAPGADDASVETQSPATRSEGDSTDNKGSDADPSVATTLLLIAPPRFLRLTDLLCSGIQELEGGAANADNAAAASNDNSEQKSVAPVQEATTDAAAAGSEKSDSPPQATDTAASDKAVDAAPKAPERRLLTFAGNRFTLDVKQWPLLGKPDAKHVFVEMFDYTCPHCRNTHFAIAGAMKQYGDDLAILVLPVPLESGCNPTVTGSGHAGACELARIAIAVWRIEPSKFIEFHDWMFAGNRTAAAARLHAETLVSKEKLKKELGSGVPSQYITRHVKLYEKVGSGQVPKLIFPAATLNGEVNSSTSLCSTIERELSAVKQ